MFFIKKIVVALLIAVILSSCQSANQAQQKDLERIWGQYFKKSFDQTEILDVFVATNRMMKSGEFGCLDQNFSAKADGSLKFGICKINVPKNHINGEINFSTDSQAFPDDYFKIISSQNLSEEDLIKSLKQSKYPALIFVHGFNVKYQEAVLRTSGIAYDLKYQGPIIAFSWPAGAKDGLLDGALLNKTYTNNLISARNSVELFKDFLLKLQSNNIEINLIVHSMGHQLVIPALVEISEKKSKNFLIDHLILNAADFEIDEFKRFSKNIQQVAKNITLYCSGNDKAMIVSRMVNDSKRLGACGFIDGFDVINVGPVTDEAFGLGHGYYSSREILTDVFQALIGIPPEKRLFITRSYQNNSEKYLLRK